MLKNLIRRVGKKCKNNQTEHLVPACCMCCLQAAVLHCSGYLASAEHRMQNFPGIRDEKKVGLDSQIIRAKYRVPIFTLAGWKIANFNGFNFNPEQSFILASLSSSNEVQRNNFPLFGGRVRPPALGIITKSLAKARAHSPSAGRHRSEWSNVTTPRWPEWGAGANPRQASQADPANGREAPPRPSPPAGQVSGVCSAQRGGIQGRQGRL